MRLLAVALALFACKPSPPQGALAIGQLLVSGADLARKPQIAVGADDAKKLLRDELESTGRFTLRDGAPAQVTLAIERAQRNFAPAPQISAGDPQPDREMAEVAVSLKLLREEKGEADSMQAEGIARRPVAPDQALDPSARRAAFAGALQAAIHEAALALRDQVDTRQKPLDKLLGDLSSPEPRTRDYAIRELGDRRATAAVPYLITRLTDPDPQNVQRAAGALIAIGDRRAVPALTEIARKRRPEDVGPILYAIGSLGGGEAEAFLFTLESGAPEEPVRRVAHEAYADLLRKKQDEAVRAADARHPGAAQP